MNADAHCLADLVRKASARFAARPRLAIEQDEHVLTGAEVVDIGSPRERWQQLLKLLGNDLGT